MLTLLFNQAFRESVPGGVVASSAQATKARQRRRKRKNAEAVTLGVV